MATGSLSVHKNIIFDLGGVILNLNPQATADAFRALGMHHIEKFYTPVYHHPVIIDFESGKISSPAFRNKIREIAGIPFSDEKIDRAWSAMLLDIPPERVELLKNLKIQHRIFLLSNTNAIHIHHFNNYVKNTYGIKGLEALFEKCYYSSDIGYRKPDHGAYQHVLDDARLIPGETLFIDDFESNVTAAKNLGMNVLQVKDERDLFENL